MYGVGLTEVLVLAVIIAVLGIPALRSRGSGEKPTRADRAPVPPRELPGTPGGPGRSGSWPARGVSWISSRLDKLERLPPSRLLSINAGLGALVLVAHGGDLMLVLKEQPAPPGYADMVRGMVPWSLPLAAVVVVGSGVGWLREGSRPGILSAQAVVLFLAGLGTLGWAAGILARGIPEGNFAWSPGLMTAFAAYSASLLARFTLRLDPGRDHRVRHLTLLAAAAALPVDLGVFARMLAKMGGLFGGPPGF